MTRRPRNQHALLVLCFGLLASSACDVSKAAELESRPGIRQETAEKIVGGGGVELAVYDGGNAGGPPVVFIHGFSQNHLAWDKQLSGPLAAEFRLVTFDLRGHGASDKPLEAENYTDPAVWGEDLAAVIRAMQLDRPILVGWSYGGFVIADYVRSHGDAAVGGLVFVGAQPGLGTEESTGFVSEELLAMFEGVLSTDLRTSLNATRSFIRLVAHPITGGATDADVIELAWASAMMVAPEIRLAMFSRAFDNHDVLAGIQVPTLIVHGSNDRIIRLSSAERIADTVPGAKLVVYQGSGHMPFFDNADRFNRDLADFVRSAR